MQPFAALFSVASVMLAGPAGAADVSDLAGHWRTVRHAADVEIADCGDGTPCGYLASAGSEVTGGRVRDERNPDPAQRNRLLADLPLLWGYSRSGEGWRDGRLYNPETGQTFRSSLELVSANQLRVQGCLGPFCRTQTWTRINAVDSTSAKGNAHE
ncbi:DUF2147 domain-containing protein [Hyphomonas sp.]|uniref:DUF2147 domain-containing protein n=1 Tax=Hyphomonas sp. TaxID=87 RepID=UPI003527C329